MPRIQRFWSLLLLLVLLAGGCAFKKQMKLGDAHLQAQRYGKALASYERALALKPDSLEAQNKVTEAQARLFSERSEAARAMLQQGDIIGALRAGNEVHRKVPPSPARDELLGEIAEAANVQVDRHLEVGEFSEGLMIIDAVSGSLPSEVERMAARRADAVARWVQTLESTLAAATTARHPGDALLCAAMIAKLTGAPEHLARRDELRRSLDDTYRYVLAPQGKVRDVGFMAVAPEIATRDPGPLLQVLAPRQKGRADATLGFALGSPRFQTTQSAQTRSVEYQSGTRQVQNPSYKTAEDKVTDEERRLNAAESEVEKQTAYVEQYTADVAREGPSPNVSTGAEQNLSNAQSRLESARRKVQDQRSQLQQARESLRSTEQFKEEPVYSTHSFNVLTYAVTGTVRLTGKVTHRDGRPMIPISFDLSTSASDETHLPQGVANVKGDPLTLPSQTELSARLWADARARLEAVVVQSFRGYRQRFFEQALAASSEADAIEQLVAYILLDPSEVEAEVVNRLKVYRHIPSADALLKARPAPPPPPGS